MLWEAPIKVCDERHLWRCVLRGTYGGMWREPPVADVWEQIQDLPNSKLRLRVGCREKCRSCPKRSKHWRKEDAFIFTEKGHYGLGLCWRTYFLLWRKGDYFLTCLNKPKLWTKLSLFKAGCSSWSLASRRRHAGKIDIYFVKDQSIIPANWRTLLHFQSFLTMWKQLIFKISNGTWLPRCFWSLHFLTSSKSFLKNKYG